jgi:hypothetical protein
MTDTAPTFPITTTPHRRLPGRRAHELIDLDFRGHSYVVGVGRYADGALAGIFIDAAKVAKPLVADARESVVALSLAFQHGVRPEDIRAAVSPEFDSSPAGVVGAVLDLLLHEAAGAVTQCVKAEILNASLDGKVTVAVPATMQIAA